jgi:hypothetical protein
LLGGYEFSSVHPQALLKDSPRIDAQKALNANSGMVSCKCVFLFSFHTNCYSALFLCPELSERNVPNSLMNLNPSLTYYVTYSKYLASLVFSFLPYKMITSSF